MDVEKLLDFQPEKPSFGKKRKRPLVQDSNEEYDFTKKKVAARPVPQTQAAQNVISDEQRQKIIELVDETPEAEPITEISLKRLILQFEKRVSKNQEMRIKFPDLPEKFLDSEMELNDTLQELHVLATSPDLYHVLVELNAVQTLLQLLAHENTDIAIAVVDLLQELTDVDALHESEEAAEALIDAVLSGQGIALLVQNMERLDEAVREESDGVHNSLAIVENMSELKPEVCGEAVQQGIMTWLLKRIKAVQGKTAFDANKLYCSEILAILVQSNTENRKRLGEQEGIDVLLSQLATYKRHNPATPEEAEYMENLFDCLCSVLMLAPSRARFLRGEGLQLMNLMLREKKQSRFGAIKLLNHAVSGSEGADCCQKLVDILGLRSIFPLLMKTPSTRKIKGGPPTSEVEEHVVSIVTSLLCNCTGAQKQRVLSKFTENDHEKVERLMELHFKYMDKVRLVDTEIERERRDMRTYGGSVEQEAEDGFYLRRLDAGLFTLQLVDLALLHVCAASHSQVKQRVLHILNLRGGSAKSIRSIIREYAGNVGDEADPAARKAEQDRILALLEKF